MQGTWASQALIPKRELAQPRSAVASQRGRPGSRAASPRLATKKVAKILNTFSPAQPREGQPGEGPAGEKSGAREAEKKWLKFSSPTSYILHPNRSSTYAIAIRLLPVVGANDGHA